MKILFMGTPEFAVPFLSKLIETSHTVVGVFTQPDRPVGRSQQIMAPPVKQLALKHHLPVFSPEKIRSEEVQHLVLQMEPEVIVVVAYGKILPGWMLEMPRYGAVNVHASLLPKYRGAAPIQWAVANGEQVTGVTTMKMDAGLDTGDILLQQEIPIRPEDTSQSLHDTLSIVGADLLLKTLTAMDKGTIHPQKQDHSQATVAPILKKEDGKLDWSGTAETIHNHVRAFNPWPGTFTRFRGKRLRIWRAALSTDEVIPQAIESILSPGTLFSLPQVPLGVRAGDGKGLALMEVQLEGHRRMSGEDFAHGFRIKPSEALGQAGSN